MISYQIQVKSAEAHIFEIRCELEASATTAQRFSLPVWTPGSYLIREFAKHVLTVRAEVNGMPLAVGKIDKHSWQCAAAGGRVALIYEVYAFDLSVRGAYLDTARGFFNGASVFVWPQGREAEPCSLLIAASEFAVDQHWRVATSLPRAEIDQAGFGQYLAATYDELIDHPVEISNFEMHTFEVRGIRHRLALSGKHHGDLGRLIADVSRICEEHIRFYGEVPFTEYLFQLLIVGDAYGGLEHRASTSLIASRKTLPRVDESEQGDDYRTLLGLFSHEYFHAWNVKSIKPAAFIPYDLSREAYTSELWLYEGMTSYYDDIALVRSGVVCESDYFKLLAQTITRVLRGSGRLKQSVADARFDAWIKFYRPDENAPNALVSYYAKGSLIALALDLTLRCESSNERSLDDVMQALWLRYGKQSVGVPQGEVENIVAELAGAAAARFLHDAVNGTADLPLERLLREFGLTHRLRAAESAEDLGGAPAKSERRHGSLGVRAEGKTDPKLLHVFDGGAAQIAGLAAGDQLLALDGLRITNGLDKALRDYAPGHKLRVHAFRRDELLDVKVSLDDAPRDTCFLQADDSATAKAVTARRDWLKLSTDA